MLPKLQNVDSRGRRSWTLFTLGLAVLLTLGGLRAGGGSSPAPIVPRPSPALLPLSFEPNAGQTDEAVRFLAHAPGGTLFFTDAGLVLSLKGATPKQSAQTEARTEAYREDRGVVRLQFLGANPSAQVSGSRPLSGRTNYIKGKAPSQWHTNVPTFGDLTYSALYDGISLSYEGDGGQLEAVYTVAPGADASLIRWRYSGAQSESVDETGDLHVTVPATPNGQPYSLTESAPLAWQEVDGKRVSVAVRYRIAEDAIGFELGPYDHGRSLVIDPTIIYSTYLGGFRADGAGSVSLDAAGNIYIGGTTSSSDFPLAGNPFQPVYGGGDYNMFVSKLSPDGSTLIYSTFVGGGDWDLGGIAGVDPTGVVTLGGWTTSENFPTTPGAYQTSFAGTEDVAIARLSVDGSSLVYGSYWGDEGVDESYGFAVDGAGNTYFTGYYIPGLDSWAFVAALSPDGSQQLFRHNLGGSIPGPGDENANTSGEGIVVDGSGNIYVTGYTRAADFPVTAGAYRTSIEAYEDGFITKLDSSGQSLVYSTYIPGGVSDYPYDVAVDSAGNAYITGNTSSSDYPVTAGAFETSCGDPRCAFLTKLNPQGSALVFSSFLGGPAFYFDTEDYGLVVRVNQAGNAYVGGYTSAPDFPVVNPIQGSLHGPNDGFLTKFDPTGSSAEYSTYLGGGSDDYVGGLALDGLGHVYVAGSSSSTDFPTVNPLQPTNHGDTDAFLAIIAEEGAATATPTVTGTRTPPTATSTATPCGRLSPWRTETPMPVAHSGSAAAVVNNQLYVIAGAANSPTPVRYTQRFDPASGSWSNRAAYPDGVILAFPQAAAVDGKIYTVGNTYEPSESFIEMYDPGSDSWTRRATLPEPLLNGALASYAGKLYVIGGQVPNEYPSPHVYRYDPVTDTFATMSPMPTGQAEIGAAAIGRRIYAVGGYQYIHYVYDPSTDSWSTIATPPTPSFSFPAVFGFNGELWVIGGYDNWTRRGYPPDQQVQIYNPATNSWRYGPALNRPRYYSTAAGVIGNRAYLAGGIDLDSNSYPYDYLDSVESIAYVDCLTGTPTPLTTPVTGTPARTGTVTGTATAVGSATPCAIAFSDVHTTDYFYQAVAYLYCRGAISGYADGTFRPFNNATRGQLSKIAVLAEGWDIDTTGGPHFSDVPASNPFYAFIETAFHHATISGYADGTFRWGNDVTRGQLSKIVVLAEGWAINTTGGPHFSDVPPADPFYGYIETAYNHAIISGYADGTFRPGSNATRGQISKIVYNAITNP